MPKCPNFARRARFQSLEENPSLKGGGCAGPWAAASTFRRSPNFGKIQNILENPPHLKGVLSRFLGRRQHLPALDNFQIFWNPPAKPPHLKGVLSRFLAATSTSLRRSPNFRNFETNLENPPHLKGVLSRFLAATSTSLRCVSESGADSSRRMSAPQMVSLWGACGAGIPERFSHFRRQFQAQAPAGA